MTANLIPFNTAKTSLLGPYSLNVLPKSNTALLSASRECDPSLVLSSAGHVLGWSAAVIFALCMCHQSNMWLAFCGSDLGVTAALQAPALVERMPHTKMYDAVFNSVLSVTAWKSRLRVVPACLPD